MSSNQVKTFLWKVKKSEHQENCPPPPPQIIFPQKIAPYEYSPLWKLPSVKITPRKLPPGKITPNEIPSPLINHINERKNKITKIFSLKKAVQYNILTSLHTGPRYFLYRMKKIQKSNESENHQVAFTCQLHKSRRTKTRQSNYKIWQICETTKWHSYHLVNFKKSKQ